MTRRILGVPVHTLVIGIGAVLAILTVQHFTRASFDRYERRVAASQVVVDSLRALAESLVTRADSLEGAADSLVVEIDRRAATVQERIVYVRDSLPPAPDTCAPFIAARDEIIDSLVVLVDDTRTAFDVQKESMATLRLALQNSGAAADSLQSVLDARPKLPPAWMPKLSVGVFGGMCFDGQPCAGVGAGLTWDVPVSEILSWLVSSL